MRHTDKRAALSDAVLGLVDAVPSGEDAPASRGIVSRALEVHKAGLTERVEILEAERSTEEASGLRVVRLDPAQVHDPLPPDRDSRSFSDPAFASLQASIAEKGQDVPITVRRAADGSGYDLAAGRRRLAACKALGLQVLARVLTLGDDELLALQYRENAERSDVSPWERGCWLAELAARGLSTTRLASLLGLSQPMIVEYLKLGRLPRQLVHRLSDPRQLSIGDGRRLHAHLVRDDGALARMLAVLGDSEGLPLRVQLGRALTAATGRPAPRSLPLRGRVVVDGDGRKLATVTQSGAQWVFRLAPGIEDRAASFMADRLPELFRQWQAGRGQT